MHNLRTPSDFRPGMISTPRPGFSSTFGTGTMLPRTPYRYHTPIPRLRFDYGQYTPEYTPIPARGPEPMPPQEPAPSFTSPQAKAKEDSPLPSPAPAFVVTPRSVTFDQPSPCGSTYSGWGAQIRQISYSSDDTKQLRIHGSGNSEGLLSLRQWGTQTSPSPLYVNTGTSMHSTCLPNVKYQNNGTNTSMSCGVIPSHMSTTQTQCNIPDPMQYQYSTPDPMQYQYNVGHGASRNHIPSVNPENQEARQPNATIIQCEHSCKPKAVEAPTFNGKDKWDTFISLFQKVAEINKWDNTTRCERLLVSLRGSALEFVDTLQLKVTKDYDSLKQALAQRFGITSNEALYRVKFKGRRRNQNEDLDKYIQDLQYLAERAYPNERSNIYHRLIVDQFIEGISNRDCKQYLQLNLNLCKESDSSLVQEVLKYAHNYESVTGGMDRVRKPYEDKTTNAITQQSNQQNNEHTSRAPPQNNSNGKRGKNKNDQGEGRQEPSKSICFKCKEEGHIATRCPQNTTNGQGNA